jgi:hypothetical protein
VTIRIARASRSLYGVPSLATGAGALHPLAVVDAWDRLLLLADARLRLETVVKENEHCGNAMLAGDLEEPGHPLLEPFGVRLPDHVVEKHPDGVEAQPLCPE